MSIPHGTHGSRLGGPVPFAVLAQRGRGGAFNLNLAAGSQAIQTLFTIFDCQLLCERHSGEK